MDLSVFKGPGELLTSRVRAFKNCLELASECLSNRDYPNAAMIYAGLLSDLHNDNIIEALNLNELEVFSLHGCFAYSTIGSNCKSEEALLVLNQLHMSIKLPLVPYLKAFVHMHNDRVSFAHDELVLCQTLLNNGYNFKPNRILNKDIVPELNEEVLKLKLNGLRFVFQLITREDKLSAKQTLKEDMMKLGNLCHADVVKMSLIGTKIDDSKPQLVGAGKTVKPGTSKTKKQALKMDSIAVQTASPKMVTVSVQTVEKEINKQLISTLMDIRNKVNSLHARKDNDVKHLQRLNSELNEKLLTREENQQERSAEFEFLKEQYLTLEKKWEHTQKQNELLQKLLVEQMQQRYNMQKSIYQVFEEKCGFKIEYLNEIYAYLNPRDKPTTDECNKETTMWRCALDKVIENKRNFEMFYRTLDDLIVTKKFALIKTNDWPGLPAIPRDNQDMIYNSFKGVIIQSKNYNTQPYPTHYSSMFANYGHYKDDFRNPSYLVSSYNTCNEDGRTTGSPWVPPPPNVVKPVRNSIQHQGTNNKRFEHENEQKSPKTDSVYQTEEELIKFIQISFGDVVEGDLLDAVCQVRDTNGGGTLIGFPKQTLVREVKKILNKGKGNRKWSTAVALDWHSDSHETRCCICFDDYDSTNKHTLTCKHEFHKKCITNWLKRQNACPVCRVHAVIDEDYPPLKQ